ncbi:MAG: M28 family peptidase [Acidimicrobiia bacterium]
MLSEEGRKLVESISIERIMETIRFLSVDVGRRITGTPQEIQALQYFETQYRELKIDTQMHEFGFLLWDTEDTSLEILGPASRTLKTGYASFGTPTPPRGIVAELVHIDGGWPEGYFEKDVKGKVVLVARYTQPGMGPQQEGSPYRFHCVMNAARRGAVAYVEYDPYQRGGKGDEQVRRSHGQLTWGNPTSDMVPTIPILSVSHNDARLLKNLMAQGTVKVKVTALPAPGRRMFDTGHNLIATLPGDLFPDDFIVLCGHIDAAYSPGANDNASGTSMPLEIARVLKQAGISLRRTLKLCHWTAEHPSMIGSTEYVLDHFREVERHCCACLNFENMGHIDTQTFWMDRCPELIPLMDEALEDSGFWSRYHGIKHFRKQSLGPISDHNTFYWDIGAPAVEYHWGEQWALGADDTIDKCDPEKIKFGCRLGLSTLLKIANSLVLPYDFAAYSQALQEVLKGRVQARASDIRFDEALQALRVLEEKGEKLKKLRVGLEGKYDHRQPAGDALAAINEINEDIRKTCHVLNRRTEREPLLTSDYGILFELEEKAKDYLKIREAVQKVGTTNYIDLSHDEKVLRGRMRELVIEQDLAGMARRLTRALDPLESAITKAGHM